MSMKLMWEIRAFCTVVEKRSFIHAARMLGRSPSAVTRAIQFLEEAIGAELILRTQKQFTLTTAGETYYASAKHLLETQAEAEEQLAELSNSPQGWVRLSAPEILSLGFLPKVVAQFSRDYPNVSVDIHFSDKSIDPIQEKLDFAIRGAFPQSSELIGYPLWNYRRYMYASPAYIERMGAPDEPEELAGHDIIMHSAPASCATGISSPANATCATRCSPASALLPASLPSRPPWKAPASCAWPAGWRNRP